MPAQAILQLNKAFAVALPDQGPEAPGETLPPWPWSALAWILRERPANGFLGNPVRHFQHYASRMPPQATQRSVRIQRAWLSLHLAEAILPSAEFPRDRNQIEREALVIPAPGTVLAALGAERPHETALFLATWQTCVGARFPPH